MGVIGKMIFDTFVAIGEEEQEACIHCGKKWYKMHYHDGVCHSCQLLGKPGRSEIKNRKRNQLIFWITISILIILLIISIFSDFATK